MICFVVPTLKKGGLERVVSILSNNLINVENVCIITLSDDEVEYSFNEKVRIVHLNNHSSFNRFILIVQLIKSLKKIRPSIVVGFSEVFNPITIIAARFLGLKVFISDRSSPIKKHTIRDKYLKRVTYRLARGIVAQTELSKKVLLNKGLNRNVEVIPNPISDFKNSYICAKSKSIVTLGRLVSTKNQIELIKIFKDINNKDWRLIIAGDGEMKDELEKFVFEQGLTECVRFLGKVEDIEAVFSQASIFAFTSLSEGFPNALMEGMCYPLASIAYDCPAGVSDLISNNTNGYLIPLGNYEMYKSKLSELMDYEYKRMEFMQQSIKHRVKYSQIEISKAFYSFITK